LKLSFRMTDMTRVQKDKTEICKELSQFPYKTDTLPFVVSTTKAMLLKRYAYFIQATKETAENLIPKKKHTRNKKASDDHRVVHARNDVHDAFKNFQRSQTPHHEITCRERRRHSERLMMQSWKKNLSARYTDSKRWIRQKTQRSMELIAYPAGKKEKQAFKEERVIRTGTNTSKIC